MIGIFKVVVFFSVFGSAFGLSENTGLFEQHKGRVILINNYWNVVSVGVKPDLEPLTTKFADIFRWEFNPMSSKSDSLYSRHVFVCMYMSSYSSLFLVCFSIHGSTFCVLPDSSSLSVPFSFCCSSPRFLVGLSLLHFPSLSR